MLVTWNSSKQSSRRVGGDLERQRRNGVVAIVLALTQLVQALVHFQHEGVEMDAALALDRCGREKQIHQHRLAAADRAENIEALRRWIGPARQAQALTPTACPLGGPVIGERVGEAFQLLGGELLARIGLQPTGGHAPAIAGQGPQRGLVRQRFGIHREKCQGGDHSRAGRGDLIAMAVNVKERRAGGYSAAAGARSNSMRKSASISRRTRTVCDVSSIATSA